MKKLEEHVILYDAACPMCKLYTRGFQKAGMLDQNGRLPYQQMPDNLACLVDQKRSVDEIALVDTTSRKVYYGVESLLRIIVPSFPFLKGLTQNVWFLKIADKLYKFVSFNRRVIIPAKKEEMENLVSNPSFHQGYRIAYLVFTCLLTVYLLHVYSFRMSAILPASGFFRELIVCGGQLLWQGVAVGIGNRKKVWDYLGNMMTISMAGGLILALVMLLGRLFSWENPIFYLIAFGSTVSLMLAEHIRRNKILGLGWGISASWVLYRIVVLSIIIFINYVK